ncbi:MAG: serine acetyltransferase [Bacteroidaceae bacterium]|nr:serine acetyltransferase [Bacteroidaceae bacterium]
MKDIAIFGAGGFGREVACLINIINGCEPTWNLIGFFDEVKEIGTRNEYGEILGGIDVVNEWEKPLALVIAIGDPHSVKHIVENVNNAQIDYPNLIAPDTIFLDRKNITFGRGNIVCSRCLFSTNVRIGDFNTFNGYITVGHDSTFGDFNSLMPAVRISGEVNVGNENFFGVDAVVIQHINIGNRTRIGANSLIIRKTKDDNTYVCPPTDIL